MLVRAEPDPVLHAQITPGLIEYTDSDGKPQKFYFQCNPTSLTRSRSIDRANSQATNQAAGTKTVRGQAGQKYSLKTSSWKIDSIELWFDASMPHWTNGTLSEEGGLAAVQQSIEHLEAISEPAALVSENETQTGAPPLPGPPLIVLTLGRRSWKGHVSSLTILEKDFTPDLIPRQIKATLGLELVVTESQLAQNKLGGKQ